MAQPIAAGNGALVFGHRSRSLSLLLALDHQRASLAAFLDLV